MCTFYSSLIQPQNGLDPDSGRVSYERNGVSRQDLIFLFYVVTVALNCSNIIFYFVQ